MSKLCSCELVVMVASTEAAEIQAQYVSVSELVVELPLLLVCDIGVILHGES